MNAKVFINEYFVALPKYNFGARSFETKQEQILLSLLTCVGFVIIVLGMSPVHHNYMI